MIVNGIFWDEKYPRLLTKEQMKTLAQENRLRLLQVADISCDINVRPLSERLSKIFIS
jgi:alpha-aminoadipic semialdehyde synthase